MKADLVSFVENGGGFVVVHAANNSSGDWPDYNRLIGMGGWGGRSAGVDRRRVSFGRWSGGAGAE